MNKLDRYLSSKNLSVIRSYPRLPLVQLDNLKLVEIHIVDDNCYSIQEVTKNVSGRSLWDTSLENINSEIEDLEATFC